MWQVNNGDFEAETLEALRAQLVEYYAERSDAGLVFQPSIEELYFENDYGHRCVVQRQAVVEFEDACCKEIDSVLAEADAQKRHEKSLDGVWL